MSVITYLACPDHGVRATPRQSVREVFARLLDQLIDQGRFALRQLQSEAAQSSSEVRALFDAGYLRLDEQGQVSLTGLALRASEERMFAELFRSRDAARSGRHELLRTGVGPEPGDEVQPYQPGAPLDHVELQETLRQSLRRGLPLALRESDLRVRPGPSTGRSACVLLIDQSGSMARHGKFAAARRAALALRSLIRNCFPGDVLFTAGFASRAWVLADHQLLYVTPCSVGLFDSPERSLRVADDAEDVPQHFTNLQAGLRLARRLLRHQTYTAKQILLLTDGEPTAHVEGQELVLAYPPTEATYRHTLVEARCCARERIALSVVGLVSEFAAPGLEAFVHQLAQAGRGHSVCCSPRTLAVGLVDRFLNSRLTTQE